jgi:hypothetical protein
MASCTGCGTNNSEGVRPNLSCPPDLSQLLFRFIERKRLGVVKGKNDLASLDMSQFFIPLNGYTMNQMNLCDGETLRVDGGSGMDLGKRREIQEWDITSLSFPLAPGVTASLEISDGTSVLSTLNGLDGTDFSTFITSLKAAISGDSVIQPIIEFYEDDTISKFSLRGINYGKAYVYTLTFDDGGGVPITEVLASTVTQTALRYPRGAWKVMFLNIVFCSDCTSSNQLYIEYAYDSDVVTNGESGATWRKLGPMLLLSGAEDVTETDTNKIETIWLRNTQTCDVEIQAILAI